MPGVIPEKVNSEQSKAIKHGRGPLLIVAGAGTGKTTVVTERIAHLIMKEQVPSDNILALTFTDKAAGEMQDRVERILPFGYVDLWVMTFHSFGERLLKAHALDSGLSNDFKLLSATDQWLLIREHLDEFDLAYYRPLGNPTKFISALVKHFSRLKDEDISPDEYLKHAKALAKGKTKKTPEDQAEADRVMELAKAYATYNQLLLDNNALDFGDLILYTLRLLRDRPAILKKYQQQFQYILVDEFQDTNWAQYELIKRLAAPRNNLTVVGDDDQSIYKFRGASVSNIIDFKKDFPDAEVIVLTKNYRTKQAILDLAHGFIQKNNPDRLEAKQELFGGLSVLKKLTAQREGKGEIHVFHQETQEAEARAVADRIEASRAANQELSWDAFCVLVRANDHAQNFISEFERRGMPHLFLAAKGLFTKPLVLDVLAYLRLLDNYHDSASLYRLLAIPLWGIDHGDVVEMSYQAKKKTRSLYEQLRHDDVTVSEATRTGVKTLLALIAAHTELANTKSVGEVLLQFLNDSGYLKSITKNETTRSHEQVSLLRQLFKVIETFQQGERPATVKAFLKYIEHVTESGDAGSLEHDIETGPETIKIMTIHAAKGLEFPYVFIGNVVEQRFPGTNRADPIPVPDALVREHLPSGDAHLQEERRLMYVAITRARDGIFFTLAEDYGGQRRKKPSAFLYELGLLAPPIAAEKKKAPLPAREFKPSPRQKDEVAKYLKREKQYSFTKLATYNDCPWKYRYAFVLQVPKKESYALSYGSSIHKTLYNFFSLWQQRAKEQPAVKETVSLTELLTMYQQSFIDDWYPSKKLMDEYRTKGEKALTAWYAKTVKSMPSVLRLEQVFNLKVDEFVINGAIDRIDRIGGTDAKPEVKIVDYKTGKVKEKFDKDDKYQLLIYALAVKDPNILNGEVKELEYSFIDENATQSMTPTEKDATAALEWIRETVQGIQSGNFKATPNEMVCKFCDFREICEYRAI